MEVRVAVNPTANLPARVYRFHHDACLGPYTIGFRSTLMCTLQHPELLLIEVSSIWEITLRNHGRKILFARTPPYGSEIGGWERR